MSNHQKAELRARAAAAQDMRAGEGPFTGIIGGSAWSVWYDDEYKSLAGATRSEIESRLEELTK